MDYVNILIPFVGGLGMFIYGMQIMSSGLENAAGDKMKTLLEALTKNKLMGVALGALVTAIIQSSSATTVMIVGFVNAGVMNLTQAMGVIMGANVGTTITGWLVSAGEWASFLKPATLAPIAIMAGVILMLTGKRRSTKDVASIIVGFGLLFVGISTMSDAVAPLKENEAFCNLFVSLGGSPLLGILVGAVVTAVIQSSSASVGILQSLAAAGLVPFSAAIYIIMGQNIGTCVTSIMSSMGAKKNAKAAALMHLLFNIIGTVIFSIAAIAYLTIVNPVWAQGLISQTQISTVHTIFNIATTVLLFPMSGMIVNLAKKISGVEDTAEDASALRLDERMLETPGIAIQSMVSEIVRMGHIVNNTVAISRELFSTLDKDLIQEIRDEENKVDGLSAGLTEFAVKLSALQISEREHQIVSHMIQVVSDMERVCDYCENLSEYAELLIDKGITFSETGKEHLGQMFDACAGAYQFALEALEFNDSEKALRTIEKETEADGLEISLRSKHIKRLTNNECNTQAGIVFLDTVLSLERISDHARNIAEEVLDAKEGK